MINEVSQSAPQEEYAKATFYLVKEVGLSHEEIFGGKKVVKTDRGLREVYTSSMNVNTFHAYLELLEEHNKEKEKEMKKQKMKNNMRSKGLGGA